MAHFNQSKTINTLIVSALRSQQVQVELEDSINITYGVLDTMLDTEKVPVTQIIPCVAILSKKRESHIANIFKKPHNFMRKTKNYLSKNPNDTEKLHPDFSEEEKEKRPTGHVGVFCENLGITAYTLENYSNFKSNFSFGSILEIHDYFRTMGKSSFNDLPQLINTQSNQDFAGLDKFRLRKSLGELKEMCVRILKINKNHGNVSSLSEFLSSPFSPTKPAEPAMAMGNTSLPLTARKNTSLALKKREPLLESKLQASSEKISSLQGTASLLNMCLGEENQDRLKTDKELQILDKDLKETDERK